MWWLVSSDYRGHEREFVNAETTNRRWKAVELFQLPATASYATYKNGEQEGIETWFQHRFFLFLSSITMEKATFCKHFGL